MSAVAIAETDLQLQQGQLDYRMAHSRQDRLGAFQLVYHSYLRAGLGVPNRHGMRVTPFQLGPGSQIFVAVLREQVVSTVTLVGDSTSPKQPIVSIRSATVPTSF